MCDNCGNCLESQGQFIKLFPINVPALVFDVGIILCMTQKFYEFLCVKLYSLITFACSLYYFPFDASWWWILSEKISDSLQRTMSHCPWYFDYFIGRLYQPDGVATCVQVLHNYFIKLKIFYKRIYMLRTIKEGSITVFWKKKNNLVTEALNVSAKTNLIFFFTCIQASKEVVIQWGLFSERIPGRAWNGSFIESIAVTLVKGHFENGGQ